MSIRTSLYNVSRRPTSTLPASASTSTRIVTQSPRTIRAPSRQITTTRPSGSKPRKPSLIGQFFGIKPREPPPIDPAQVLRDASDTLRVLLRTTPPVRPALLHKPYEELVSAALSYRSKQSDPLDLTSLVNDHPQQVEEDIRRLAGDPTDGLEYLSGLMAYLTGPGIPNAGDLELAIRVYGDMRATFGREPSWEDEICLVRARAMLRQPSEAMEVLRRIEPPPGPDSDVWALVTCANVLSNETRPSDGVRAVMRTMAAKGIEPPLGAWCALLGAARPEEMNAVLRALPETIRDEPRVWAVALEGLGANATKAKEVADTLRGLVERQGVVDTRVWAALVAGGEDPYEVVRAFDRAGGKPDEVLLRALVRAVPIPERTLDTLRKFESLIGVEGDEGVWSVLVEAAVERGEGIVGAWSAASESGMSLSSETLDRVVGSAQVSIVDKLVAYRAVNVAWPVGKGRERERGAVEGVDVWMRRDDTLSVPGPTVKTYSALLGALVAQRGNELDKMASSAAAVELLTDMRARGIKLPQIAQASTPSRPAKSRSPGTPLSALASLTILLMENAPSHEAAFKTYAYACVIDPSGSFGAKEYRAVLKAFASLRIPRSEDQILKDVENWSERPTPRGRKIEVYAPPPAALYYEIMRDMQKAGCDVAQSEYSTILRAYAAVCLELPEETDENELVPRKAGVSAAVARAHNSVVLEHIQRVHTLLKLDTNLTPDTALFNSLMLAYSRAGAWENVLAIWNGMKERDAGSISIVLDTLGRSGRANLGAARTLWEQLRRKRVPLSVNNWTSWVEALCRLGEFDEAERVVFSEMREVDEKTLRTLVSFAWRVGRQAQVLDQARRRFPGVI